MGFGLDTGFIDLSEAVTGTECSSLTDSHTADLSEAVTTTEYSSLTDSHTESSQCAFTSFHYPFPGNGFISLTVTLNTHWGYNWKTKRNFPIQTEGISDQQWFTEQKRA
jgi:hypothetical protein